MIPTQPPRTAWGKSWELRSAVSGLRLFVFVHRLYDASWNLMTYVRVLWEGGEARKEDCGQYWLLYRCPRPDLVSQNWTWAWAWGWPCVLRMSLPAQLPSRSRRQASEGKTGHEMVSYWGCSDDCASGCRLTKDSDVNAYGMSLASEDDCDGGEGRRTFLVPRALACWADDDDMSHVTVVGHGLRVPD